MDLDLVTREEAGHTVLEVSGEVDVHTAPVLRSRALELIDAGRHRMVVDVGGVEFLDSSGLGVLVEIQGRLRDAGGTLALARPADRIRKLFVLTGLDEIFSVHATVEQALAGSAAAGSPPA